MRWALVIPPYVVDGQGRSVRPNKAMLPVGPFAVAAALLERGHEVEVLDLVFERDWIVLLMDGVLRGQPDTILVSCHTARNIPVCREVVTLVRRVQPYAHVVFGGNVCAELGVKEFRQLDVGVDTVVRGYGHSEEVSNALVAKQCGDIRGPITPELPLPALHLLTLEAHKQYLEASGGRYPIVGPGGFGCLWSCGYCAAKMSPHVDRKFDDVPKELDVAKALGYTHVWCGDNLVTIDPDRVVKFDQFCVERGLKWSGMTRPELVVRHSALASQLRACEEIAMGIEAVATAELRTLRRGAKSNYLDTVSEAFRIVTEAGINTNAFVILGGPQATEDGFWSLYGFLKKLKLTTVSWSFFNPPAHTVLNGMVALTQFGFYRWPMCGALPAERVVQQVMILSGTWWSGWRLKEEQTFFEDANSFGVNFREGTLYQERAARSPIGDLWKSWRIRQEVSK